MGKVNVAWKVYFWFMVVIFMGGFLSNAVSPKRGWLEAVFAISNLTTLAALYGFSFSKKIATNTFWKGAFFVCVLVEILDGFTVQSQLPSGNFVAMAITLLIMAAIVLPIYVATFLYAFKWKDVWGEAVSSK